MEFQKLKPQTITYSNYKTFDHDKFQADIKTCISDKNDINSFKKTFLSVFIRYALIKKKYILAKEAFFLTKSLRKKTMKPSMLRVNTGSKHCFHMNTF